MIDHFSEATLDSDPMHVDPEWARRETPFGGTIAFGFLTLSLLTHLMHQVSPRDTRAAVARQGYFLNYGIDRMRLISPVPAGSRVRGHFQLKNRRQDDAGRWIITFLCTVELEGAERPALVAEWVSAWVAPEAMAA